MSDQKIKCTEEVRDSGRWPSYHRCTKPAKIERGGKWYCTVHDPERVKERDRQRMAEYEAEQRAYRIKHYAAEMLALLIESQESIGGDWRDRRDALIAKATKL